MTVPRPLLSPEWLAENLDESSLRILDATAMLIPGEKGEISTKSGRALWEEAHVPHSSHVDLIEVSDQDPPFSSLPGAQDFAERMSALGVGEGIHVVAYDNGVGVFATRLWWLLRVYGFDSVSVLDGGFAAWQSGGYPVSTEPGPGHPPAAFEPEFRPELVVDTGQVEEQVAERSGCLINALTPELHRGEGAIGYGRPGRIPGSINMPSHSFVDSETHRYLSRDEVRALAEDAGALDPDLTVATYCGRGLGATMTAFGLALAGRDDVAVYDGSLQEWTADPERPVETG